MLSSALNKLTSNISSNYSIASQPSSAAGPWKVFDGKHRANKKLVSIFIFDRKSLDPVGTGASFGQSRGGGTSLRRAHDAVVERLRKEAGALARLRHPSILELVEPVEDTRNGGLMFATEPVTASLAGLLAQKDVQGERGVSSGRSSRHFVEGNEQGGHDLRGVDLDELEIQKGLLQLGKGLEFLHESAGLVHANLTPDAILINSKSDWKISGLGFSSPPDQSTKATAFTPISLSEVLNYDPRLPRNVQLNLNFTSPDFILDTSISTAADMFSLGLIIIAMYNEPHQSPIDTGQSISNYKRIFSSPSTVPTINNNFQTTQTLPRDIKSEILPRLITRRPTNRFAARDFQQAGYFDNILVSTIRFLDSLPGKTANEKSQFLRGLPRILSQFPMAVLEKKVLPALLEEAKDSSLLSLIMQNAFKVIEMIPDGRHVFTQRMIPTLRSVFAAGGKSKGPQERDSMKEGGLMIIIENMTAITNNCSAKEFKEEILPILYHAFESSTVSVIDAALSVLPHIIPVLDFSTIKNELFPVVAAVFSKTSSMAIKVRSLKSLFALCGGSFDLSGNTSNDFTGMQEKPRQTASSSTILDKYTIQEKVVPLLKGIKTKEPAVMMAALDVFKQVGVVADPEFLAIDVLPTLWAFALGPLLDLQQFHAFMASISSISKRIEQEQTRKLKELASSSNREREGGSWNRTNGSSSTGAFESGDDIDFEALVTGRKATSELNSFDADWSSNASATRLHTAAPASRISGLSHTVSRGSNASVAIPSLRTGTSNQNLSSFAALTPNQSTSTSAAPQQASSTRPSWAAQGHLLPGQQPVAKSVDWSSANPSPVWSSQATPKAQRSQPQVSFGAASQYQAQSLYNAFPHNAPTSTPSTRTLQSVEKVALPAGRNANQQGSGRDFAQIPQKQGMEKYESLI